MPIHIHYNPELNYIVLKPVGVLTIKMLSDLDGPLISSEEFPPDVNTIWDMRETDYSNINKTFLEELIELRNRNYLVRGKAKLAYVASSDFEFGITRMYEMLSVNIKQKMHIFRTIEEAETWLTSDG